jgi:hypothetical protein
MKRKSDTTKRNLTFDRKESITLPVNQLPVRAVPGADWERLKRLISRVDETQGVWLRIFDGAIGLSVACLVAVLTPNDYVVLGVSVRTLFGFGLAISATLAITAGFASRSEKEKKTATKEDLEEVISDVEQLYDDEDFYAEESSLSTSTRTQTEDDLYAQAIRIARDRGSISTSRLQRTMRIGYARAARMVDQMEEEGIVGESDGARPRPVIKP